MPRKNARRFCDNDMRKQRLEARQANLEDRGVL